MFIDLSHTLYISADTVDTVDWRCGVIKIDNAEVSFRKGKRSKVWTEGEALGLKKSTFRLLHRVPVGQGRDQGAARYKHTPNPWQLNPAINVVIFPRLVLSSMRALWVSASFILIF